MKNHVRLLKAAVPVLAIACVLPLAKPAAADVKIVSKVAAPSGGLPGRGEQGKAPNSSQTVTTYYKGNKTRIEDGSRTMILDSDAGKIYQIDGTRKTYTVRPLGPPPEASRMMGMLDIKTTADIKPNGKTRVIAGKPTKGYTFHATITMGMKQGAMGKPGGGAPPPPAGGMPPSMGTIKIDGEQWVTQAIALPTKVNGFGAGGQMGMGGGMPGMKALTDKLTSVKGLPLATTQTITGTGMMGAFMGGGRPGGPPPGGAPGNSGGGLHVSVEAISINEAPLPATLFSVPAGFKQEQAPAPGMGRGPGGGPRPGMMMPPPGGAQHRP